MTGSPDSTGGPVRPIVALALATVSFIALVIFALGMVSLAVGADIVEVRGLGQIPGIVATALATAAFALSLWLTLRRAVPSRGSAPDPRLAGARPSFWGALWAALACYVVYVVTMWIGVLSTGADLAVATGVAGRIATTWFGVVVAASGAVAAWGGIALVRTRAQRPRWPWEDEFDE
ncbi:hypothetical protein [Microbacterium sp.]|uniref:hypothetical protein n=1 Tax=Microbacterium sp. TaxID=51671 RepID=UPI002E30BEBE|nr:hypothetical protein [Microbacterium sp.]HEX5728786.1 hypothetical protein [Microbacterium sp.]